MKTCSRILEAIQKVAFMKSVIGKWWRVPLPHGPNFLLRLGFWLAVVLQDATGYRCTCYLNSVLVLCYVRTEHRLPVNAICNAAAYCRSGFRTYGEKNETSWLQDHFVQRDLCTDRICDSQLDISAHLDRSAICLI